MDGDQVNRIKLSGTSHFRVSYRASSCKKKKWKPAWCVPTLIITVKFYMGHGHKNGKDRE